MSYDLDETSAKQYLEVIDFNFIREIFHIN